jgi:hypothetical protein
VRAVLALSLTLLTLVVVLENAEHFEAPRAAQGLADRALELVIGAKGPLLPAALIGGGPERIGEALRIGDRTLVASGRPGLRAAFIGPDLSYRGEAHYDVGGSAADAAALTRALERAEEGDVLVLASSGSLAPPAGTERSQDFEHALVDLGARARPGTITPESWALIALRAARGWLPLAEGYSTDSGVALTYVLGADLAHAPERPCDLVHARAGKEREVELLDELVHAAERTPGVELAREGSVRGRSLASLAMGSATGSGGAATSRIVWERVEIGPGSCVGALLGLDDRSPPAAGGARFQVFFEGELVAERAVEPGAPWRPALFDLRPFAGRRGTLALVTEARPGVRALWGRPQLLAGYERSPLEAWAEER